MHKKIYLNLLPDVHTDLWMHASYMVEYLLKLEWFNDSCMPKLFLRFCDDLLLLGSMIQ
jgi:hypothetical protein